MDQKSGYMLAGSLPGVSGLKSRCVDWTVVYLGVRGALQLIQVLAELSSRTMKFPISLLAVSWDPSGLLEATLRS